MKINRINVLIQHSENRHRPYLCNEILKLMSINGFGGEFKRDSIKLSAMPEYLLKELEEKEIKFVRVG